jgi:hypothetical protein
MSTDRGSGFSRDPDRRSRRLQRRDGVGGRGHREPVLNIYNWSDYIADDTGREFQRRTGIEVHYDVFDSNEVLETKLLAANTGYDLVVPTGILHGAADHGRRLPAARQIAAAEPEESRSRDPRALLAPRPGQRLTRSPTCGAPSASATT